MVMPDKLSFEFNKFNMRIIYFSYDFRIEIFIEKGEFLFEVNFIAINNESR